MKAWAPLYVVKTPCGRLARCRMVLTVCPKCSVLLEGANIADVEIYWGAEDPSAARERSDTFPKLGCPKCAASLDPRLHLIWVHEKADA